MYSLSCAFIYFTRAADTAFTSEQVRIECPPNPHLPQVRVAVFGFDTCVPFDFLSLWPSPVHYRLGVREMDYEIDLDPVHSVIRVTVTAETVTLELPEKVHRHLSEVASSGGPYAVIYDLSAVKFTMLPTDMGRSIMPRSPLVPMGRKHVIVGKEPHISRFASLFHMCTESIGEPAGFILTHVYDSGETREIQVVYSLEEAYEIVGARPEDFTERLVWPSPRP